MKKERIFLLWIYICNIILCIVYFLHDGNIFLICSSLGWVSALTLLIDSETDLKK